MGMQNLAFVGIDLQRQLVQYDRPEFVVAQKKTALFHRFADSNRMMICFEERIGALLGARGWSYK